MKKGKKILRKLNRLHNLRDELFTEIDSLCKAFNHQKGVWLVDLQSANKHGWVIEVTLETHRDDYDLGYAFITSQRKIVQSRYELTNKEKSLFYAVFDDFISFCGQPCRQR